MTKNDAQYPVRYSGTRKNPSDRIQCILTDSSRELSFVSEGATAIYNIDGMESSKFTDAYKVQAAGGKAMNKAFVFRIYPNKEQRILLAKTFGCARFIWNQMLSNKKDCYETTGQSLKMTVS